MNTITPHSLFQFVEAKGYVPPMAAQVTIDNFANPNLGSTKIVGTGEHLKNCMEVDRLNVFKAFYTDAQDNAESTWLAGDDDAEGNRHGMILPTWAERLMHAEVMHMQEKIDTTMDYLMYVLEKQNQTK